MIPEKIGFVGLGLIGGSIAKCFRQLKKDIIIVAADAHEDTITQAYREELIENEISCSTSEFYDCDYIFLCAPIRVNIEYLRLLKDHVKKDCIITDVGSVKSEIHREAEALFLNRQFIGGHPMAGSEKAGLSNARVSLLENAFYILTPTKETPAEALEKFAALIRLLGAIPIILDHTLHDYATAAISHLPHVIAYNLVNLVRTCDDENETMKTIAAGGFKDITRIASSSPAMWEHICLSNKKPLARLIDTYVQMLLQTRDAILIEDKDSLTNAFSEAKNYRDSIAIHSSGVLTPVYEIYLDLLDEVGQIAAVAALLAQNHLSIKNIGIIHNREFEEGVLRLEMYDKPSADAAIALLQNRSYKIYKR